MWFTSMLSVSFAMQTTPDADFLATYIQSPSGALGTLSAQLHLSKRLIHCPATFIRQKFAQESENAML